MSNVIPLHTPTPSLYENLMNLVNTNESFYFSDQHTSYGATYRIFLYRIASYSDFCLPNALEARGIMFLIKDHAQNELVDPILVCRPMNKFFNIRENPFTLNLNTANENICEMYIKSDGSLISTYVDTFGRVQVKSKGSISSPQATAATLWLNNNPSFLNELQQLTVTEGYTVNMEFVAPENRIVVLYEKPQLIVLNIRHTLTGHLIHNKWAPQLDGFPIITQHWVESVNEHPLTKSLGSYEDILEQANSLTGIEGFVVYLNSGESFKLKNDWYLTLHRTKDSVTTDKALFEVTINEAADDVRSLFYDNPIILDYLDKMHEHVTKLLLNVTLKVTNFFKDNCNLERKEYAIQGQAYFNDRFMFNLAMALYLGKKVDFRSSILDNYKQFLPNPPIIPVLPEISIE